MSCYINYIMMLSLIIYAQMCFIHSLTNDNTHTQQWEDNERVIKIQVVEFQVQEAIRQGLGGIYFLQNWQNLSNVALK